MNHIFHSISKGTVSLIHIFYRLLVYQTYFVLSNCFVFILLIFVRLTLNNFILFFVPLILFIASLCVQFGSFIDHTHIINIRKYQMYYRKIVKKNWILFMLYSLFIAFLVFCTRILFMNRLSVMIVPFALTSCFLVTSMLFVLLLSSDVRAIQIPFKKKIEWSLMISYRLPIVTIYNTALIGLAIFLTHYFSFVYLLVFSSAVNYGLYRNLTRGFSMDRFFEEYVHRNDFIK